MAIRITAQPKNVTARVGDVIYFTVAAEGEGLTYQWQFRTATSGAWIDTTRVSGYNTPTIKINATANTDGNSYRCIITDANGNTVASDAATLYVAAIAISAQPTSAAVYIGDVIYFTVAAEGEGLTYQWQFRTATSGAWIDTTMVSGYNTPTIKINATANTDGNSYRCAITDANGNTVTTDAATLYLVDGALSAGKGFMSMSIMSDIAEAIRAKTESTGMILPAEMAAKVRSISADVLSGSYTLVGNNNHEFNLGVSLPRYSSYVFMVYKAAGTGSNGSYGGYNLVENGVVTDGRMFRNESGVCVQYEIGSGNSANAAKAVITIDFDTGAMSSPALEYSSGTWNWWYFEVKGASA